MGDRREEEALEQKLTDLIRRFVLLLASTTNNVGYYYNPNVQQNTTQYNRYTSNRTYKSLFHASGFDKTHDQ